MPVTHDRLARLREFGLSEYAARSYLALLDLGIAEARDVSSISKVPQAKIYHVLEQLHDRGLVAILPEFPKKYAPVPFEEYLSRVHDEHTKAAAAIERDRAELSELFRVLGHAGVGDRGFFTVVRGRRNVLAKIAELVAQTKRELVMLGTSGSAARAHQLLPELRRARERGVTARALAPVDAATLAPLAPVAEVVDLRVRELSDDDRSARVAIVISDASRAFLVHFVPDDGNLQSGKDVGVFTDQEAMVAALQALVEPHWVRAPRYARRRAEILAGREPEFTRLYHDAQEARGALGRALAAGARSVASVHGIDRGFPGAATRWRALVDASSVARVDDLRELARKTVGLEIRRADARGVAGQTIVDDREVFYTLGSELAGSVIVVHTNVAAVVGALSAQFEALWASATSLDARASELTA